MKLPLPLLACLLPLTLLSACNKGEEETAKAKASAAAQSAPAESAEVKTIAPRNNIYTKVELTADLSGLSDRQRQMVAKLIDAAKITDNIFWEQVWGDRKALLKSIKDRKTRRFAIINYGPWDRLDDNLPFVAGVGPRPPGAQFYPQDMTRQEFDAWEQPGKDGNYSVVRRNKNGTLRLVPYSKAYRKEINHLAATLEEAAALADDPEFGDYLRLRADALRSDDYQASDMAWMDMKNNPVEVVIGPVESYEDALFGYRTAFETFVLIKDQAWSERLARFVKFMPQLQQGLPVPDEYKREKPGSNADLNAYDLLYCAGDCNAGAKTIAINLPNDEAVQLAKGTRRLQLENAIRAKFDKILVPIANTLIAKDQRGHITFDAFFGNTMFHEVAHGLGIKTTLDGKTTVRAALKDHASALEEGKADILGLYMIQRLRAMGEITEGDLMDNYVTFLAGILRSVRWGAANAHGRANMIRFNYFAKAGAFTRDATTGTYRVDREAFEAAVESLSRKLLTLQGDGDYQAVADFVAEFGHMDPQLEIDLKRLAKRHIPVDIIYEQGKKVLGL